MINLRIIGVVCAMIVLAACSGGGGRSVISSSSSYSVDGSQKTITTNYSDGTQSTQTLQGTLSTPTYSSDGTQKTLNYLFPDGSTRTGATLAGTLTTPSYSTDGSQKTLVYFFSDGSTRNGLTLTGTLTTPSYSADGSQKTLVYSFTDGSTRNGATLTGTIDSTQWASDHMTKTTTYRFTDGSTNPFVETVNPTLSTPTTTAANYPSDWLSGTSTGTVTKPVTSLRQKVYGDGFVEILQDGSATKPFTQSVLAPNGGGGAGANNDPNAFVSFTADAKPVNSYTPLTLTYDLRWGTPDPLGPKYAINFDQGNARYKLPSSTFIFRAWLSGGTGNCTTITSADATCGATLSAPSDDVIDAWNKGWTGKGSNVLIWDNIGASPVSNHPAIVQTIAYRYALGAKFYGMSWSNADGTPLNTVLNLDGTTTSTATPLSMHAINMSFGANLPGYLGAQPAGGWTDTQLLDARTHFSGFASNSILLSNNNYQGAFNFLNAVIVKSAGNDSIDAQYDPANWYLTQTTNTLGRLLIVGALDMVGSPTNLATIASYSNKAGIDPTIQSRFLVESGAIAYPNGNYYAGSPLSNADVGTSFAAPRVSAYVAIIRQKFPNLTAPNTADILLSTARYDTLTCYQGASAGPSGGCDKTIYGQGEASLSRALAPVGYLR